ncbi:MAG: carbohydrate ABC transporter permease [Clostridiales bacterium]|jgi:multiple sugar transport system permease protein|nr:carbohydrate ABC transporter permease [Clostridiales bacterium]
MSGMGKNAVRLLIGSQERRGLLASIVLYLTLAGVSFVFLYPILFIISGSAKDIYDLSNPLVRWVPTKITFDNYVKAYNVLGGFRTLGVSLAVMLSTALAQTAVSALVGYGLAKYQFWGKPIFMGLLMVSFILPPQTTFLSKYVLFNNFKMIGTVYPVLLPSLLGQGLKSAIFILIFYQFFKMAPKSLDEAAFIDGAGHFTTFWRINLALAAPAIVVVFIFSFVWNWNDTYLTGTYFGTSVNTLPLMLERFVEHFRKMYPTTAENQLLRLNEGLRMAGTLLTIIPLVIIYVLVERRLIESIDRAGITGE